MDATVYLKVQSLTLVAVLVLPAGSARPDSPAAVTAAAHAAAPEGRAAAPAAIAQVAYHYDQSPPAGGEAGGHSRPGGTLSSAETVARRLEEITADTTLDSALKESLAGTWNQTLALIRERAASAEQQAQYDKSIGTVGERLRDLQRQIEAEPGGMPDPRSWLPITRVREEKASAETEVAEARDRLQQIQKTIRERQSLKETLPQQIQRARKKVSALESTPEPEVQDDPTGLLKEVLRAKREAKLAAARQRAETLSRQQARIEAETDLLPLELKAAEQRLARAERVAKVWSDALRKRRESQIEGEIQGYRGELKRDSIDPDDSLVLDVSESWMDIVAKTAHFEQLKDKESAEASSLDDQLTSIRKEISESTAAGRGPDASLGLRLQLARNGLPAPRQIRNEIYEIDAAIDDVRVKLAEATLALEAARGGMDQTFAGGVAVDLPRKNGAVHPTEERLLSQFIGDIRRYLASLIELRAVLDAKLTTVEELQDEIDAHVMWVPNHARFSLDDAHNAWAAVRQIFHPAELKKAGWAVLSGLVRRPDILAVGLIALGLMTVGGPRIRRRLLHLGQAASPMQVASLKPTWVTFLLTVAQSLPLAVLLWAVARAIRASVQSEEIDSTLAPGLDLAAAAILPIEFVRQMARPHGLMTAHFGFTEEAIKPLRKGLRLLIDAGLPLVIVWAIAQRLGSFSVDASLGRVTFGLGMILLACTTWRVLHPTYGLPARTLKFHPHSWLARLRFVWLTLLVGFPLALAGLSLEGHSFAAVSLIQRVYWTLWLGVGAMLVFGFIKRWLLTQRRNLWIAARNERLEAMKASGPDVIDYAEESRVDVSEISAQSSRLLRTAFTIVALVGLAWIWSPVLPAIRFLEAIRLWEVATSDSTKQFVTLASLVRALPILVLTWVAVGNLPGLIEGVLLERLPLQKAARYAITSLTTYGLTAIGVMMTARTLGLRWESIQWLVAALGVGLGFGLQEIFANFVSGLILLFEQPIRVGDIVTLGDTTGVVSRIRIRATTVTNWDRQELVIPNKDLITGRLINWTLSDSTNRVTVNVGVAYGSDTRLACQILHEICRENSNVAEDPPPIVTFEGFGDSTLNLVVRCFLTSLENRLGTIHELHTAINDRFGEMGIEIAFPQRDLHVRSFPQALLNGMETRERAAA